MISPFAPITLQWHDLSEETRAIVGHIASEPSLKQLIGKHNLRAYQYLLLLQNKLITDTNGQIELGETARGWVKRYLNVRTFESGDLVTIIRLHPKQGSRGFTRHWIGYTAKEDGYRLSLYSEDWTALQRAGYTLPGWHDNADCPVSIDVYVSREMQTSGWRIAGIINKR